MSNRREASSSNHGASNVSQPASPPPIRMPIAQQLELIKDFEFDPVAYAYFITPKKLPEARFTLADVGMKEMSLAEIRKLLNDPEQPTTSSPSQATSEQAELEGAREQVKQEEMQNHEEKRVAGSELKK